MKAALSVVVRCLTNKWKCISRASCTIHYVLVMYLYSWQCVKLMGSRIGSVRKKLERRNKIGKEKRFSFRILRCVDKGTTGLDSCEQYSCYKIMHLLAIQLTFSCFMCLILILIAQKQCWLFLMSFTFFVILFLKRREN